MCHLCWFVPPFFKFLQKVTTRTTTTTTTFKLIERDARVENGLGPLKTKSPPYPIPGRNPPPDFVLRGPNPLLKVIKLSCHSCVLYHMFLSRSINGPLQRGGKGSLICPSFPCKFLTLLSLFSLKVLSLSLRWSGEGRQRLGRHFSPFRGGLRSFNRKKVQNHH